MRNLLFLLLPVAAQALAGSWETCQVLVAGSDTRTLANPIAAVLQRFGVTIDDGSGQGNIPPTAGFSYATSELTVTSCFWLTAVGHPLCELRRPKGRPPPGS